jgi:diguanylate cyclase (GGDEF)-like protein
MDFLTNVHNRRGFEYVLQVSWEEAKASKSSLSLFMIDIDDFKRYNDYYGHQEGDKCLAAVAKVIADSVRKADIVARYGGEEFAVILRDTPREAAERISRRMFDEMEKRALPNEQGTYPCVTFSVGGMTCHPAESGFPLSELVRKSDEALYIAKAMGKNRTAFHPESL